MTKLEVDVVIVGAGYAGLFAARDLIESGKSVLVLEASHRVGGRVWSKMFPGTETIIDWGAEWVLPAHHHALMAELQKHNLELEEASEAPTSHWLINGTEIVADYHELVAQRPSLGRLFSSLERRATEFPEPDLCLHETIRDLTDDPLDAGIIEAALYPLTGADPKLLSLAMLGNEIRFHGGSIHETIEPQHINRIRGGAAALVEKVATELGDHIRFGARVTNIDDRNHSVFVSGNFATVTARKCIVALPLNTLRGIEFSPSMKPEQESVAEHGNVGRTAKLWALVEGSACPASCYLVGAPLSLTYAKPADSGRYLICGQALVDNLQDRSDTALTKLFSDLYPANKVLSVELHDWVHDELARGSWHSGRKGFATAVPKAFNNQGNITFAGGDYMDPWCGWIEGAILSGRRAASNCR